MIVYRQKTELQRFVFEALAAEYVADTGALRGSTEAAVTELLGTDDWLLHEGVDYIDIETPTDWYRARKPT